VSGSVASVARPPTTAPVGRRPEQTRAREPDQTGVIVRDGVHVAWERYGDGSPTILLMPTWSVFHSRHWKLQIPYLARHFRVVTFDGRGNGRSDRPVGAAAYADTEFVADALAVLDATETGSVVVAGLSMGAGYAIRLAAEHPGRVLGLVLFGASVDARETIPDHSRHDADAFEDPPTGDEGWALYNAHVWRRDWPRFADWFTRQIFSEPHSTKPLEDGVGWFLETDPETIIATERAPYLVAPEAWGRAPSSQGSGVPFVRRVRCPALVVHGTDDRIIGIAVARTLAASLGAPIVEIEGGGHAPIGRDPVLCNRLLRDFVRGLEGVR
jgi:pimeloyl-ACP methyl ester carboxylesterase